MFRPVVVYEDSSKDRRKRAVANAISNATLPPIVSVLTFVLVNYAVASGISFVTLTVVTTFFAAVVPLTVLVVWARRTHSREMDVPARAQRNHPLLVASCSYLFGAVVLLLLHAPALTTVVMFGYGVGTLVIVLINLRWKISIHAMGIAGPTAVLILAFGSWGLLLGLLLPAVMWSRIYLKKHTLAQMLAGALLGFEPDWWQRDVLTAADPYVILNCCRQSGKTTVVSVAALHYALTHPESLVLIVSPSERQSAEFLKKIKRYHRKFGSVQSTVVNSAIALEFHNGSRIVALPSSQATVRGFSAPSLVLIDEAAQVPDDLYHAVLPMLSTASGRLILLSTPYGKRGFFYHAWELEPDWKKITITADQCPRITKATLERHRLALAPSVFAQEYYCEFVQGEGCVFNEAWLQYFDLSELKHVDLIVQSWDTAQTNSATSDYVVGQVWARRGADFYLLDLVRGKMDFDETVEAITRMKRKWRKTSAILIEAQALGAALASHLKWQIPGVIPIHVKGAKQLRALNCVPLWQSKRVFIPTPESQDWVRDYVLELTNFPGWSHDDQVDATTLALNQLQGLLFPSLKPATEPVIEKEAIRGHHYVMGWIPARLHDDYTLVVYDLTAHEVVRFARVPADPIGNQVLTIYEFSTYFNGAECRVIKGVDDALTYRVELRGVYIKKVKFDRATEFAAYENLSELVRGGLIRVPGYPELIAEMNVFGSEFTFDESPDYTMQTAQQSGIRALALCTYNLDPTMWEYHPRIYANFDLSQVGW